MRILLILILLLNSCAIGHAHRNQAAKNEFKRFNPCPSTGLRRGKCHGYVIDHKIALACNGNDLPSNMQWQTVQEANLKDKWERKICKAGW